MFRLLGPLEWELGDRSVELGPLKQRRVFAALLADVGRPVTWSTLVERVWDNQPEADAKGALYTYVNRIRRLLENVHAECGGQPVTLVRRAGGYVLVTDPDTIDLHRFRRLVVATRIDGCTDSERRKLLQEALELWQGTPLADLPGDWPDRMRTTLAQERLDATVAWAHLELQADDPQVVLDTVRDLLVDHPLVEPLAAVYLRALHGVGRTAEALHRYAGIRARLADELGADPGPELRAAHQAILAGGATPAGPPAPVREFPAHLPVDLPGFAGREDESARLDAVVERLDRRPDATGVVAVSGTAGVGKTALVVHWSHRNIDRFPDGQLFVDLRGFGPATALERTEALRRFLDALGVPPERIPLDPDAQVGLYRSLLAQRRMLVILDNARDADQVRPLLPGSPHCLTVVTSRDRLVGLVTREGAEAVNLDVLTAGAATELLSHRLGADRIAAEPAVVGQIIARCGGLPLALAIVAARAATRATFPLAALASELEPADTLDPFDVADRAADLRTVLSWSYRALGCSAAALFRLLGLHPGPDLDQAAAMSLTGQPAAPVRLRLAELCAANLLTEHRPGRFAMHDVLRSYAAELAGDGIDPAERHRALVRLHDHYVHGAHRAAVALNPHRATIPLDPPSTGVSVPDLAGHRQATHWFTTEHQALIAILNHGAHAGLDRHTWQLAWALTDFFQRHGYWTDQVTAQLAAVHAAGRLADPVWAAKARHNLARSYIVLGRHDEAEDTLRQGLALATTAGDVGLQANTHMSMALVLERLERITEALDHAEQALARFTTQGDAHGRARALNMMGWYHATLGNPDRSLATCRDALALLEQLDDRYGQACTLDSIGFALHGGGDPAAAIPCFHQAIRLVRDVGDRFIEATMLDHLGDAYHATADTDGAATAWRLALDLLEQLGHADAGRVGAKLRDGTADPSV